MTRSIFTFRGTKKSLLALVLVLVLVLLTSAIIQLKKKIPGTEPNEEAVKVKVAQKRPTKMPKPWQPYDVPPGDPYILPEGWCDYSPVPPDALKKEPDEVTVVTMYMDLGTFQKGNNVNVKFTSNLYKKWIRIYGRIANRVVAYIEKDEDIKYFRNIRSCFPAEFTKIIKIDRKDMWAFNLVSRIAKIYTDPKYPKHFPNTVVPEYPCTMHAKHEVIQMAIKADYFQTKFISWLDVGMFRLIDPLNTEVFKLLPPANFDQGKVGMAYVDIPRTHMDPEMIFKKNLLWVAGGMFLGTKQIITKFTTDYMAAVEEFLDLGLSNSDQQVIASMYTVKHKKPHYLTIQAYKCNDGTFGLHGSDVIYFCLAYSSKVAAELRGITRHTQEEQKKGR